jgi:hypothetical protein
MSAIEMKSMLDRRSLSSIQLEGYFELFLFRFATT